MEPTAAGNPYSKLDVALLHTPQHIEAKIGENEGCNEACVSFFKFDKQLVEPRYQRPISKFLGDVAENSTVKPSLHLHDPQNRSDKEYDSQDQL
jgi:hypothetical protein